MKLMRVKHFYGVWLSPEGIIHKILPAGTVVQVEYDANNLVCPWRIICGTWENTTSNRGLEDYFCEIDET